MPRSRPRFLPLQSSAWGMLLWFLVYLSGLVPLLVTAFQGDALTEQVLAAGRGHALTFLTRLLWLHLSVGFVLGLIMALPASLLRRPREGRTRRRTRLILLNLFALLSVSLFGMVDRPIFLDPLLNLHGGMAAALQRAITWNFTPTRVVLSSAVLLSLWIASSKPARTRVVNRRGLAWLALAIVALLVGRNLTSRSARPLDASTVAPHVLLVGFDSLRPDRLAVEGYPRPVMPHVDALIEHGTYFSEAYVPLARTLPSWASILTATDPHTHGFRHMFPRSGERTVRPRTLPRLLHEQGYRTFVVSDYAGESFSTVDFGFDEVDAPHSSDLATVIEREILLQFPWLIPALNHRPGHALLPVLRFLTVNPHAEILTDRALEHIDAILAGGSPFLATVFYSGPHIPYAAAHPGYRRFTSADYRGPNQYGFSVRDIRRIEDAERSLPAEEVEQVRALYDGAATVADRAFGRLLDGLRRRGVLENTIVVVLADHGEHLFEHGNAVDHGKWFRGGDAANRIPLVFSGPGVPEASLGHDFLVRSTDIAPTLLALLGIEKPASMEGEDLSPVFRDPNWSLDLPVFAETGLWLSAPQLFADEPDALIYPGITSLLETDPRDRSLVLAAPFIDLAVTAKHRMLRTRDYKLVYEPLQQGVRYRLHDVHRDPGNEHDLSAELPDVLAALKTRLHEWLARDPARKVDEAGHVVPWVTYAE